MHRIFRSFVDALACSPDARSLESTLLDVAEAFDLPLIAYFAGPIDERTHQVLISNYPAAWTDRYTEQRYDRLDPVVSRTASSADPFRWGHAGEMWPAGSPRHRFFEEAAAFGIRDGLTIPIADPACRFAALTFASDRPTQALYRATERHARVLQLMAYYLHRQAHRVLRPGMTRDGIRLTRREMECASWAARGKSAWDIGQILGISRRTAAFHLDNLRAKLGVHSIAEAVAILAAGGHLIF